MTPLREIESFQEEFCLPNLYIKDESKNRFGTWKDRRSKIIISKAVAGHVKKLCLITSGNAGFSLSRFAAPHKIKIVCVVDKKLQRAVKQSLKKVAYKTIEVDLSRKIFQPEEIIMMARENNREVIWDVTNGYEQVYGDIIKEVVEVAPDIIICPVGSGEAFVGLYDAIKKEKLKAKLVGVSPRQSSSSADKLSTRWTPYEKKMKEIIKNGNWIVKLSEKEIKEAYTLCGGRLSCEPSASVVFGALKKMGLPPRTRVVAINSGKGLI